MVHVLSHTHISFQIHFSFSIVKREKKTGTQNNVQLNVVLKWLKECRSWWHIYYRTHIKVCVSCFYFHFSFQRQSEIQSISFIFELMIWMRWNLCDEIVEWSVQIDGDREVLSCKSKCSEWVVSATLSLLLFNRLNEVNDAK